MGSLWSADNRGKVKQPIPENAVAPSERPSMASIVESPPKELRGNQIARIASQQIARVVWKDEPEKTIAAMVRDDRVQKYGGAKFYVDETVRGWIQQVAPAEVSAKKGRPKKKIPTDDA